MPSCASPFFHCLSHLYRSIDQLNRERKLQQSTAGSELRNLEDQYYSALRKNLEISAACQAVEDDMQILQARVDKLTKADEQQQQEQQKKGEGGEEQLQADGQAEEEQQQQQAEQPQENGVAMQPAEEGMEQ
jgi:cysteinyl-tRNA synthetase